MSKTSEDIIVPRSFRLLAELEDAEKNKSSGYYSYGLAKSDDMSLTTWNACIIPRAGDMFLPVVITCGPSYPDKAPIVSFGDGFPDELKARLGKGRGNQIDPAKVAYLRAWNKKSTMRDLLVSMSSGL